MSTLKRWFVLSDNQVTGPYEEKEIETQIQSQPKPLIWGRGLSEWVVPQQWREALKDPNLYVQDISHEPQWKYRQNGKDFGPMSFPDLISVLKKQMDLTGTQVWNDSQQEWNEIYLVEKVADELGVSRRVHPRVPIMGTLTCETPHGTIVVKAISISEGGLGVNEATTLKIGEKYKAVFASPNLYASINCTVEVMYVGAEGYAGLRFFNLPIEAKSAVIEYVNKFKTVQKPSP